MASEFLKCFDDIQLLRENRKIAVAVSGGIDSLSLVILANEWGKGHGVKVVAITVDHQLRPSSKEEALYVGELLKKKYGIEHHILTWEGEKPKTNVENAARNARYRLIFDFCTKNGISTILLGHHLQDQAENFLIRLFRGSGIAGLSSMQQVSKRDGFNLVRPFLYLKKDDLREFLVANNIKWVEDESNHDEKYLRNKIRNFLNSFDDRDNIVNRINSTVNVFQTAENIIEERVKNFENTVYFYDEKYNYYTIKLYDFLRLDSEMQYRILIKILKSIGENKVNPRFAKVERLIDNLETLKKYTFYGCVFERINVDEVVCYREYNSIKDKSLYLKKGELNKYLKYLKENNYQKYREIKDFKGYKKEILYTLPVDGKILKILKADLEV